MLNENNERIYIYELSYITHLKDAKNEFLNYRISTETPIFNAGLKNNQYEKPIDSSSQEPINIKLGTITNGTGV